MRSRIFLVAALLSIVLPTSHSWAATATIRDAGTLQLDNVTFRLDGIDTPTVDQLSASTSTPTSGPAASRPANNWPD
jgi:hypothetical protein